MVVVILICMIIDNCLLLLVEDSDFVIKILKIIMMDYNCIFNTMLFLNFRLSELANKYKVYFNPPASRFSKFYGNSFFNG